MLLLVSVLLLTLTAAANCQTTTPKTPTTTTTTTTKTSHPPTETTTSKPFEQSTRYRFSADHRQIFLPNVHRPGRPSLKFSITNGTVIKVYNYWDVKWGWVLSDHYVSIIEIRDEAGHNVNRYEYSIPGTGSLRELCFDYAHHSNAGGGGPALWYGTYQNSTPRNWPLNSGDALELAEFNSMRPLAHDTAPREYYRILEHLFINTDGFAVLMDEFTPLFIRRHPTDGLCFFSNNSLPYPFYPINPRYKDLSLTIFAGKDMRSVLDYVVHHSGRIAKPTELPELAKFTYPSWSDYRGDDVGKRSAVTEGDLVSLANSIVKYNFSASSEIFIDDHLQTMDGSLELNAINFPNGRQVIADLQKRGFRIGLGISGRITNHTDNSTDRYFLRGPLGELTNLVDFSAPEVATWYEYLLEKVKYNLGVDAFHLASADDAVQWGLTGADERAWHYPAQLTKKYIETASRLGNKMVADVGYKTQHLPSFVRLSYQNSKEFQGSNRSTGNYEDRLASLIPNMLAVSVGGYPFVAPYSVSAVDDATGALLSSPELYIRHVQAVAFMPAISFEHPPWIFANDSAVRLVRAFVELHQEHSPTLVALARERLKTGAPVVRPLWYEEPENRATHQVADQFMVGEDLLVAPVLRAGQRERSVVLLAGTWVDQHGTAYTGPATIKVKAPLEELPYFRRRRA